MHSISLSMTEGKVNLKNVVIRAKEGDDEAFGELYDEYHSQIYRFIFLRVGTKQIAEDIAHEVFLSAWNNIDGYQERGYPFSSWLYRIARNAVVDHYRTKKDSTDIEAIDPVIFAEESGLEEKIDDAFQLAKIQQALQELRDEHQEVVILRLIDELSVRETAQAMDKSESSVKVMQHRALKKIREILED